jgi:hypothetical protein
MEVNYILELELTGLTAKLDVKYVGKGGIKDDSLRENCLERNILSCLLKATNNPNEDDQRLDIQIRGNVMLGNSKCGV